MKFKHREHVIVVCKDGSFVVAGGDITGSSLESVKKKLDEKYNAKPFKALRWERGWPGTSIELVTVVGMKRERHWGATRTKFVLSTGGTTTELFVNTPANKRLLREAAALKRKHQKIRVQNDTAERDVMTKVARVAAE